MFDGFLPVVGLLFVFAVVIAVVKSLLASKEVSVATFPYQKEPCLFTPTEHSFLGVLERAVGTRYRVVGKVRLADVIKVSGVNGKGWQAAFNRIQSKHLDFVVCNTNDFAIQSVVELDDQSHDRAKRQSRDKFVDQALQAAGVPIFHFNAKRSYAVAEVQKVLAAKQALPDHEARLFPFDDKQL